GFVRIELLQLALKDGIFAEHQRLGASSFVDAGDERGAPDPVEVRAGERLVRATPAENGQRDRRCLSHGVLSHTSKPLSGWNLHGQVRDDVAVAVNPGEPNMIASHSAYPERSAEGAASRGHPEQLDSARDRRCEAKSKGRPDSACPAPLDWTRDRRSEARSAGWPLVGGACPLMLAPCAPRSAPSP